MPAISARWLEFIHKLQGTLGQFVRYVGMDVVKPRKIGCIFVNFGLYFIA